MRKIGVRGREIGRRGNGGKEGKLGRWRNKVKREMKRRREREMVQRGREVRT